MNLTFGHHLLVGLLFFLLIPNVHPASNAPTWSTTTDIKAGTLTITTNYASYGGYYESAYSSAFSSSPNVGIAIPTMDIVTIPNPMLWKCNLPQSTNTTIFKLSLIYVSTAWRTFKVSYLAVAGTLSYLKVDYLEVGEASLGPLLTGTGKRSITNLKNLGITINSNSNMSIIPYVSGLKINSTNSSREFQLSFAKNTNTSVYWTATCFGGTTVTEIVAYMLFYDITLGEASQELFLDFQPLTGTNNVMNSNSLLYYSSTNLLVGLTSFNITSGFSMSIQPTTLIVTHPSACTYVNISFSFWSFRKRNCLAATAFYQKLSNLCYDVCPTGFFAVSSVTKYCDSCSTYMAQCTSCTSSTVCNGCATGWAVNSTLNGCTCATNYFMSSGSCVATCPAGQWGDSSSKSCVVSCPAGNFTYSVTQTCVSSCPSPYFADSTSNSCLTQCPNNYFGNSLTLTCVTICPLGYFADSTTRLCVAQCTTGYFGDSSTRTCRTSCASPNFADSTTRTCVATCPNTYFAYSVNRTCLDTCPSGTFADNATKTCTTSCSTGTFADNTTNTCVSVCPTNYFANSLNQTCVTTCPSPYFGDTLAKTCINTCPQGYYGDPIIRKCGTVCPDGYFGDPVSKNCIVQCNVGYFGDNTTKTCVTQCPNGTFTDSTSRTCVTLCPNGYFGDSTTKSCLTSCPDGYFGDTKNNLCVTTCPDGYFGDSDTKICAQCSNGQFANMVTRTCVTTCPNGYLGDTVSMACVTTCPGGVFANLQTNFCVAMCPIGYYGDSSISTCVTICPNSQNTFGSNMTRTCVSNCPPNSFADNTTRICLASCAAPLFGDPNTNRCVFSCSVPLYAYPIQSLCVPLCPDDYYGSDVTRTCVQQCPPNLFRQNSTKTCVSSCVNEAGSYADSANGYCVGLCSTGTFGDPTASKCVTECPTGYFSQSSASSCTQACPATYFADSSTKRCVSTCPATAIADSATRTCVVCADGTYADQASNTCAACDQTCQTCSGSALNCASCSAVRTLNGSTCSCTSGIEDANGNCVSLCTDVGCDLCTVDKNVCQQCKPTFLLSGGRCHCPSNTYYSIADTACYNCDTKCAICSGPSANECTGCLTSQNREINTTTFACDCRSTFYAPNNEDICIKKPSVTCPDNYVYNATTGYCDEICGDGKLFELACDDGNVEDGDGCDRFCQVQMNYSCLYGDAQSPSICSYNGRISFNLIFAEKDMYGNFINLEYALVPQLKFYDKYPDFSSAIHVSDPTFTIESALFSTVSKTLKVQLAYNDTVTGRVITVVYNPPSTPYSHSLDSTSYDWPLKVGNGLSLTYYDADTYRMAQLFDYVTLGTFIGSLFVFILSLFFRKMIGVELILLIQTQVISLAILKEIHPFLGILTKDKYAFGYNQFEYLMDTKVADSSDTVGLYSVIGFSRVFGQNVNVMFFAICVFYFLAIIIGVLSSCKQKATAKKMKDAALILAREIAFGLLLFSLMNMITSYGLETFNYTIWEYVPEYSGTIKAGSAVVILANYAVYSMYYKESIESYVFYEKRSRLAQLQPLFIATKAIAIATGIGLYIRFETPVLYVLLGLQGAYIVFLIILRPFKRKVDFFRALIIELSILYVLGSRFILIQFVNLQKPGDWKGFLEWGLIGEHMAVALSLLMSLISLIFHLFKANKADAQISPDEAHSQLGDLQDEKEKQKRSTKHSKLEKSTHYPIQDYLENYLEDEDRKNINIRRNKLYFENDYKNNNSMTQLINISDGEGFDSKRKLNERKLINAMEIIEMDD